MSLYELNSSKRATLRWKKKAIGSSAVVYERRLNPKILKSMPANKHPYLSSSLTEVVAVRLKSRARRLARRKKR